MVHETRERRAERLAYARGYQAGIRGRWPDYAPLQPPNDIFAAYFRAVNGLVDSILSVLQTLMPEDPWVLEVMPKLEALRERADAVNAWIRDNAITEGTVMPRGSTDADGDAGNAGHIK